MKVSIITVCYNSQKYIRDAIESVLNQDYENIEYIIIDGNSTDSTKSIIAAYSDRIAKFVSEPDRGIYDAMNKGISLATGDIVATLNSDDMYADNSVVSKVVEKFLETGCDIVYGNLNFVKEDDTDIIVRTWITKSYEPNSFAKGWHPPHPTFFVKNDVYKKYGLFNIRYTYAADFELMLRFLEKYKLSNAYLDKFMVNMRVGGASGVFSSFISRNKEVVDSFKINNMNVSFIYPIIRLVPKIWNRIKILLKNFWCHFQF